MSRTHRWYQHRERITLEVPTGGETHHMTWTDGRLRLHEHDLAAEAVLLALGGEACPCLVVRDAFRCQIEAPTPLPRPLRGPMRVQPNQPVFQRGGLILRAGNPVVSARALGLSGRWVANQVAPPVRPGDAMSLLQSIQSQPSFQQMVPEARERLLAHLRYRLLQELAQGPLTDLINEIVQLRAQRQSARVIAAPTRLDLDRQLHRAIEHAIRQTVRRSRADLRSYGVLEIQSSRLRPGEPPRVDGQVGKFGGSVSAAVPASWLNRVWVRGLADVEGYLVLEVDAAAPANWLRGKAVRWVRRAGGDSVPVVGDCVINRQGNSWRLAWC